MGFIKKLGSDTAIYGLSSIIGRFLNYLLVPLYTAKISAASGGYGIITNIYSYTALLLVILTYGMETTLFRYLNKDEHDPDKVYSTILTSVGSTALLFVALVMALLGWIAPAMGYADHPEYIAVMAIVVGLDAFQAIPFSYLRAKKRPIKFATLKLLFIFLNIGLNLLYFVVLPALYPGHESIVGFIYDPSIGVGYAFFLNLVCTALVTIGFKQELFNVKWQFDWSLLKNMLKYSWPLLVLGIAGILNQTADKILFPYIYTKSDARMQLGIYGACVKIAMIMALITQAFRYAYEPLVFDKKNKANNNEMQALGMKFFIVFTYAAFLAVMAGIDVLKYIIGRDYWDGLMAVPIVMVAEIMMGIYFNLSFWYKLTDRTIWGAFLSFVGCAVMILINVLLVPECGYMACAWAGVAGYGTAMVLSYILGQHFAPINYPIKDIVIYTVLTAVLYAAGVVFTIDNTVLMTLYRSVLFLLFMGVVLKREGLLTKLSARLHHK